MNTAPLDTTMNAVAAMGSAFAKINLTLDVLACRPDGFHEIRSLVIGIGLRDEIRFKMRENSPFAVKCSPNRIPEKDNLARRAAAKLASALGREPSGCLELDKSIPIGGGLGGGSSDAATTLRICNQVWEAGLTGPELATMGAELGSDVPLFFSLPVAVITGRGENVAAVSMNWTGWVLLASADEVVSTSEVYEAWSSGDEKVQGCDVEMAIREAGSADEISPLLSNHLEEAVFRVAPRVGMIFQELQQVGVGPFRVTGAGSTMYRLFDERDNARDVADRINRMGLGVTSYVVEAPVGPGPIVSEEC